jgi:hypothetical protein
LQQQENYVGGSENGAGGNTCPDYSAVLADLPEGIISYWPLDGNYKDIVGLNDGSPEGSGNVFVDGAPNLGQALSLNGNGKVNVGSAFSDTAEFTWAVWVKVRAGTSGWRTAIGQWQSPHWVHLGKDSDDTFGDHSGITTSATPPDGFGREKWYHIASVRAGGLCQLYIDGVLAAQGSGAPAAGPGVQDVFFGVKHNMGNPWIGELDDVTYWARGLSDTEIGALYSLSHGVCTRVVIGTGPVVGQTFAVEPGYTCPTDVNVDNWLGTATGGDSFAIAQDGETISVVRTDQGNLDAGWGINLQFECCVDESIETAEPEPESNLENCAYRIFAADADSGATAAQVVPTTARTEIWKNGGSLGIFEPGQVWTGSVTDFDEFRACEPIYGTVQEGNAGTHAMVPIQFKGHRFSFGNSRRLALGLWIRALDESANCIVTSAVGTESLPSIPSATGLLKIINYANGDDKSVSLLCSADVILAVGMPGEVDYMAMPPVHTESVIGIASTQQVISHDGSTAITVSEACSDGSARAFVVNGVPSAVKTDGYASQNTGKSCVLASTNGEPFHVEAFGNGNGADGLVFLEDSLLSGSFAAPVQYDFIAFASRLPGTCTFTRAGAVVQTAVTADNGGPGYIYKKKSSGGQAGDLIVCDVPVWAVLQCSTSNDEQIMYGGPAIIMGGIRINFQPPTMIIPENYLRDSGAMFADRENGFKYGWDCDLEALGDTRDRGSAGTRYSSMLVPDRTNACGGGGATWNIALPYGDYTVTIGYSDPEFGVVTTGCEVEGRSAAAEPSTVPANTVREVGIDVSLSDGMLTLDGHYEGGADTDRCTSFSYIHIAWVEGSMGDGGIPGCGSSPPLSGKIFCDIECGGLAFVEAAGICSGCMSDGFTEITPANIESLDPPAVMCEIYDQTIIERMNVLWSTWPVDEAAHRADILAEWITCSDTADEMASMVQPFRDVGQCDEGSLEAVCNEDFYNVKDYLVWSSAGHDIDHIQGTVAECMAACCTVERPANANHEAAPCVGFGRMKAAAEHETADCWLKTYSLAADREYANPTYHFFENAHAVAKTDAVSHPCEGTGKTLNAVHDMQITYPDTANVSCRRLAQTVGQLPVVLISWLISKPNTAVCVCR